MNEEEIDMWFEESKQKLLDEFVKVALGNKAQKPAAEKKFHDGMKKLIAQRNKKFESMQNSAKFRESVKKIEDSISKVVKVYREK